MHNNPHKNLDLKNGTRKGGKPFLRSDLDYTSAMNDKDCSMEAPGRLVGGAVRADNVLHNLCRRVQCKGVEYSRSSRTCGTITNGKSKVT